MKFLLAAVGALIAGAFIVALGVLVVYVQRSAASAPFDVGTAIVIVLYLTFPLFAVAAGVHLLFGLSLLLRWVLRRVPGT